MYKQKLNLLELKNKEWWILHLPIISFFLISIIYFIVACYKLTYASLWFDEAIEFYYSSHLFSSNVPVPGGQNFPQDGNMYQKIIVTFQPPLYNFLMFFWLKIIQFQVSMPRNSAVWVRGGSGSSGSFHLLLSTGSRTYRRPKSSVLQLF